jgi:hypothetical protein
VEDTGLLDTDPKAVRGQHYDVVLNGMELGGGSIRIHQPTVQKKVFEDVLKIPADVVESRFGYMLKAFTYGAPAARRHRLRPRPHVRAALRHDEHPRRHRLPEDPEGTGPHGPEPDAGHGQAAQGTAHPDGHSAQ